LDSRQARRLRGQNCRRDPDRNPERNIITDAALQPGRHSQHRRNEVAMATKHHGRTVENPAEARQAEPGPSVFALLTVSAGLAILVLGMVWFVFFRN
jgi:hypothetical protein